MPIFLYQVTSPRTMQELAQERYVCQGEHMSCIQYPQQLTFFPISSSTNFSVASHFSEAMGDHTNAKQIYVKKVYTYVCCIDIIHNI